MYRRTVGRVRGLVYCFRHCRMRVYRAYQFYDRRLESQRQCRFGYELGRAKTDHVDAEHFVVFLVCDDLDEPFGLTRHLGATQDAERKRSKADVVTTRLRFTFGETDAADLGVAVGTRRHVV